MKLTRRAVVAGAVLLSRPHVAFSASWRVGAGVSLSAYLATRRAITATGEWSSLPLAGKNVVIKPNLVGGRLAASGATTDPEVVRAIVDLSLAGGAASVSVLESGVNGANFSACGYDFFRSYDAHNRISLLDAQNLTHTAAPVPGGMSYSKLYLPQLLASPETIFISAAKLKCHFEGIATLCAKNLIGIADITKYVGMPAAGRYEMHDRGIHTATFDLCRARPIDFAVIDGIWAMEGNGPLYGEPVRMNTVLAGSNAVAVDRTGLHLMSIQQDAVRHINYLSAAGAGPSSLSDISVLGDSVTPRVFRQVIPSPVLDPPVVLPASFNPRSGESVQIYQAFYEGVIRTCSIVQLGDEPPSRTHVRLLAAPAFVRAGVARFVWDGRHDDGSIVPPGRYAILVQAASVRASVRHGSVIGWVRVQ